MFEDIIKFLICGIVACILCLLIMRTFEYSNEIKVDNTTTSRIDEIKECLKDSITVIEIKENEEIKIVRDANNDSTLLIFKRLVSE